MNLVPRPNEMTDEQHKAEYERFCAVDATWFSAFDEYGATEEQLRKDIEAGQRDAFTANEVAALLNYQAMAMFMVHVVVAIGNKNREIIEKAMQSAKCAFCDWSYQDELFKVPERTEVSAEEIAGVNERVRLAIVEHIKTCPTHPMREMERQLAER